MSARTTPHAVVVGAGIAGLAAALALSRHGWRVTVLERSRGPRGGAFVVGFSGIGFDAAERFGILDRLRALESPWTEAQHVDAAGRTLARMSVAAQKAFVSPRLISILRGDLEQVLLDTVRASGEIDLRYGAYVVGVGEGVVALADRSSLDADLVVGADGLHSAVRSFVFGPEDRYRHDLGAAVSSFTLSDPPEEFADRTTFLADVGRGAGLYPQRGGGLAAFFTFASDDVESTLERGALDGLRTTYGDLGHGWPAVLDAATASGEIYFDSISQIRMPTWNRARVVLVGDSAWSVSLLAGYGSSLAVGGGQLLGEMLGDGRGDIPESLERWQGRLRRLVLRKQRLGRVSRGIFIPSSAAAVRRRMLLLQATGNPLVSRLARRTLST